MEKEVKEVKQPAVKKWVVVQTFYDKLQNREVKVGEEVEHTPNRESLKLIELK